MELGENVTVPEISTTNHDGDCCFCNAKEDPENIKNDLEADPDDDAPGYGGFKNDASKLGRALSTPGEHKCKVDGEEHPITVAAHHLIPGKASLEKSDLFKSNEYLWVDGAEKGNIGYNVNDGANGVWLPGSYAISGWKGRGSTFQDDYAAGAIRAFRAQFHDAHPNYSNFVLEVLNKVFDKIEAKEDIGCPEAPKRKKKPPKERAPIYAIIAQLNTVSGRMRRMLVAPTTSWKKNIYTSSRSLDFMTTSDHLPAR
jgi:hypothetical protein